MRLELTLSVILSSFVLFADWTQDDRYTLQGIRSEIRTITTGSNGQYMPLGEWSIENYRLLKEISEAKTYQNTFSSEGYQYNGVIETNPLSGNNETFFSIDTNAKDNTAYYGNRIYQYLRSSDVTQYDPEVPDALMFSNVFAGDMFSRAKDHADTNDLGIQSIINSTQTQELRNHIDSAENAFSSMFSDDYTNSVLNYDFSEIGNFFVRAQVMSTNPFENLKGQIRLKPEQLQNDYLYNIWHLYFDRSYSSYAITLYYSLFVVMYVFMVFMVMNDMMSIVNA